MTIQRLILNGQTGRFARILDNLCPSYWHDPTALPLLLSHSYRYDRRCSRWITKTLLMGTLQVASVPNLSCGQRQPAYSVSTVTYGRPALRYLERLTGNATHHPAGEFPIVPQTKGAEAAENQRRTLRARTALFEYREGFCARTSLSLLVTESYIGLFLSELRYYACHLACSCNSKEFRR